MIRLLICELSYYRLGQNLLDEYVVFQHHSLPLRRAERFEQRVGVLGYIRPVQRRGDSFHVNDAFDALTILSGPVEPEYCTPIVQDKNNAIPEI